MVLSTDKDLHYALIDMEMPEVKGKPNSDKKLFNACILYQVV